MAKETRAKPSRVVSLGTEAITYGDRTDCFPLVNNKSEKSCQSDDGDNSAKISRVQHVLKSLPPMGAERLTHANILDSEATNTIVGRGSSARRVQEAVDAFEANFKGLFVDDVTVKCIILNCRISNLEVLEALWQKYEDGTLGEMLQSKIRRVSRKAEPDDDVDPGGGYDGFVSDDDGNDGDDDDNEQKTDVTVCIAKHDYISCRNELAVEDRRLGRFDETHRLAKTRLEHAPSRDLSPLPGRRPEERTGKYFQQWA